jgi:hypothetical protein
VILLVQQPNTGPLPDSFTVPYFRYKLTSMQWSSLMTRCPCHHGRSRLLSHLAAFPSFEQLKFGKIDGEQEDIVDKLFLPSPFVSRLHIAQN